MDAARLLANDIDYHAYERRAPSGVAMNWETRAMRHGLEKFWRSARFSFRLRASASRTASRELLWSSRTPSCKRIISRRLASGGARRRRLLAADRQRRRASAR